MLIDHLIYAAPDLDTAVDDLALRFGVRAAGGGQHPGFGTHNKLLSLGPLSYLEIVAPDPGQPEPPFPRRYGVDGVTRPGLVGWAVATDDIESALSRARSHGFDPGDLIDGQRRTPAGDLLRWRATGNARTGGLIPFLIDWGATPHPAPSAPAGLTLESVHIEHPDPELLAPILRALDVDAELRTCPQPALVARIRGSHSTHELR